MTRKIRNPLAQALGLVLQAMRDKMGGVSSSQVASKLGLAASHYRMVEAGSAILQASRAIRVVQTFEAVEFVPLCQLLVLIQILDGARDSVKDMRAMVTLIEEANPAVSRVARKLDAVWKVVEAGGAADVAKAIVNTGLRDELAIFLTTEPVTLGGDEIDDFMSPTYEHPLSGRLYGKIGDILLGVAPFYLDAILQLTENLRNVSPRVTADELARWETLHQSRFSHLIGIVRRPEIVIDVGAFDYAYLWQDSFQKVLVVYRDGPPGQARWVHRKIADNLRRKYEAERVKYERQLLNFEKVLNEKLKIVSGGDRAADIDEILMYRDVPMNNLWAYIMLNGYVVPFIDNATLDSAGADLYGTSLGYYETSEKLFKIRKLCSDLGLEL